MPFSICQRGCFPLHPTVQFGDKMSGHDESHFDLFDQKSQFGLWSEECFEAGF
jgi:hypothetical protein